MRGNSKIGIVSLCVSFFSILACQKKETPAVRPLRVGSTQPFNGGDCYGSNANGNYSTDRLIVGWRNGSISINEASDIKMLSERSNDIDFLEYDQVLSIEPLQVKLNSKTPITWGPAAVKAHKLWEKGIFGKGVIVAVIDSGVDYYHPQLKDQIAINTAESLGDGIDHDKNGYINDYRGWNFSGNNSEVLDNPENGHGTHVTGIILASHPKNSDEKFPVMGVAPEAKVLPIKFIEKKDGMLSDAIKAMKYAASRGARIINASWGGSACSRAMQAVIEDFERQNILFVTASGNSGLNLDEEPTYPASYNLAAQLTIAASTYRKFLAGFSNYGNAVHLAAPGAKILSTFPGGDYKVMAGTSMAAPFVSGAAALLWSYRPNATVQQIKTAIYQSVNPGYCCIKSQGQLDIEKSLAILETLN